MRFAIFGDIHGNLEALTTAVEAMQSLDIDEYLCLGDIVGYGANPEECVKIVRDLGCLVIAGNHDHACIGRLDISYFNQYARKAALWTREQLSPASQAYLGRLPFIEHGEEWTLVHGSLQSPELFNYVQTLKDAQYNFQMMDKPLLFLGHSHQPLAFFDTDPMTYSLDHELKLEPGVKTIVNVGSIGQPRDEDPRLCFAVYDNATGEIQLHRIPYDVETAARKIIEAGLPEPLALRLSLGK